VLLLTQAACAALLPTADHRLHILSYGREGEGGQDGAYEGRLRRGSV